MALKFNHGGLKATFVGVTGFEPATSRPPDERATELRYTPSKCERYWIRTSDLYPVKVAL